MSSFPYKKYSINVAELFRETIKIKKIKEQDFGQYLTFIWPLAPLFNFCDTNLVYASSENQTEATPPA